MFSITSLSTNKTSIIISVHLQFTQELFTSIYLNQPKKIIVIALQYQTCSPQTLSNFTCELKFNSLLTGKEYTLCNPINPIIIGGLIRELIINISDKEKCKNVTVCKHIIGDIFFPKIGADGIISEERQQFENILKNISTISFSTTGIENKSYLLDYVNLTCVLST
jgi:hypothetical protein